MDGTRNDEKKSHTSPTHTREQVAKMSGVGVGTVARYDAIIYTKEKEKMDNILDKFGIYDFFGLLVPGMFLLYALICMDFPILILFDYPQSEVLLVSGFILLSYAFGIVMQEIGSFFDEKIIKWRKSARRNYFSEKNDNKTIMEKIKYYFVQEIYFEKEELEKIKRLVNYIIDDNIKDEEDKCEQAFWKCKAYLENNDKMAKADRLNAMYAMSRDFIVCNVGIFLCTIYTLIVNPQNVDCYIILFLYVILSTPIFYRRASRFIKLRLRTIMRQYMDLEKDNITNYKVATMEFSNLPTQQKHTSSVDILDNLSETNKKSKNKSKKKSMKKQQKNEFYYKLWEFHANLLWNRVQYLIVIMAGIYTGWFWLFKLIMEKEDNYTTYLFLSIGLGIFGCVICFNFLKLAKRDIEHQQFYEEKLVDIFSNIKNKDIPIKKRGRYIFIHLLKLCIFSCVILSVFSIICCVIK